MPRYVTPQIKQLYKNIIGNLRDDIGREVMVIGPPVTVSCANCGWDPVNRCSNNRYEPEDPYPIVLYSNSGVDPIGPIDFNAQNVRKCPVCRGKGVVEVQGNRVPVKCLINPLSREDADKTVLGKNYKINYELQASIDYMNIFRVARQVVVDGSVCVVVSVIPTGIGDLSQINVYAGGV